MHTQGKLQASEYNPTQVVKAVGPMEFGRLVADCATMPTPMDHEEDRDNARRLVACWNACEGIETETLEAESRDKSLAEPVEGTWAWACKQMLDGKSVASYSSGWGRKLAIRQRFMCQCEMTLRGWGAWLIHQPFDTELMSTDWRIEEEDAAARGEVTA